MHKENLSSCSQHHQPGAVFWLTGLSGSGKTTIGAELTAQLQQKNIPVVFLDGDELRAITGDVFGHTREERLKASLVYARLCQALALQSINVICATISLFHTTQEWNRNNINNYIEIFVNVPIDVVTKRDPKKIYAKESVLTAPIVGIDILPEFPKSPDVTLNEALPKDQISQFVTHIIEQFHHRIFTYSNRKETCYAK